MTRKLTDEIFALIPGLIEQGLSKAEIAARYEVTPATLQVLCCKRGIAAQGRPTHQAGAPRYSAVAQRQGAACLAFGSESQRQG